VEVSIEGRLPARTDAPDAALPRLFREHYLALVRLAVQLVDDQAAAQDVVQDVFVALQRRPPRSLDDPRAYLRSAVVNRSRSALRRRRVARAFTLDRGGATVAAADSAALYGEQRAHVLAAISTLPRRQREVVVLRFYEDLSTAEVARTLDITPGAVSSSLNRALATLARSLGEAHA
jgi:RNA polymerase sigma factor (sigma-70 family)